MTIQRPKTIVEQVALELRQRISRQTYPPGSRLPSESDLAAELGVSRTTVRTVLARFASEGLIFRKQGDGTYVNERLEEVDGHYGRTWDFSRLIAANGFKPTITTISIEARQITPVESEALQTSSDSDIISMERLFHANGRPVIYTTNIFPVQLFKSTIAALDGTLPIHKMMQLYCVEQIAYVITDINAAIIGKRQQEILRRNDDGPLLALHETFYSRTHLPLTLGHSLYDHKTLKLRLVQPWES